MSEVNPSDSLNVNDYARPVDYTKTTGPRAVARVLAKDSPLNSSTATPDPVKP